MLKIESEFEKGKSVDPFAGNINDFVKSVLVEVVSENYRQTMYELISLTERNGKSLDLDPPIRANERVMSGLFATAIARVASRSRTEVRVDRERDVSADLMDDDGEYDHQNDDNSRSAGRVDYLAWYNKRTIAIELKMASMNCQSGVLHKKLMGKWETVCNQAESAQTFLRDLHKKDKIRHPSPISIALMVVVGRRAINSKLLGSDDELDEMKESALSAINRLQKRPTFTASYVLPKDLRRMARRRKGHVVKETDQGVYTPFVLFIGKEFINSH